MRIVMLVAAALLLSMPVVATAQETASPAAPPPAPKEKKICRAGEAPTGSVLAGKRVCHTKAEWAQVDNANRAETDRVFNDRNQVSPGAR